MTRAEELTAIIAENKRTLRRLEAELEEERDAAALEACPWKLGDVLEMVKLTTRGPVTWCYVLEKVEQPSIGRTLLMGRRVLQDGTISRQPIQYIWGEVRKVGHRELGEEAEA